MAYASSSDLVARFDARTIGQLVSDTGQAVAQGSLSSDTKLAAALDDASGEIDAALMQGQRYSAADLTALTGNSLAYLKRICCQIAMARLWERRPYLDEEGAEKALNMARQALDRLRKGENLFAVEDNLAASTPEVVTPTVTSIESLNLVVDRARTRNGYFPPRWLPGQI